MGRSRETHSPEVVHQNVEDTQNKDQEGGAELGLESDNNHHTGNQTNDRHTNSPDGPFSAEHKADEEENEEDTAGQLEVHLSVLLIELRQASENLGLPDPRVGQNHNQATNDREVTEEEVEVKDQAVSEGLGDNHPHKTSYSVIGVLSDDDECRAGNHSQDVNDEEQVR